MSGGKSRRITGIRRMKGKRTESAAAAANNRNSREEATARPTHKVPGWDMGHPTRYLSVSPWSSAQRPRKSARSTARRTIGGQKERSAGESEGDESAGQFVAIAWVRHNARGVEQQEPKKEHYAEECRGQARKDVRGDGEARRDESCAGGVGQKKMRGHPRGDQGGNERRIEKMLNRSEEHTSELQSRGHLVCRLLL